MKWSEFKAKQLDWDYTSNSKDNLEKNIEIWKIAGREICDYFTQKGNHIDYSDYRENNAFKNHFIMVIDESGILIN